MKIWNQRRQDPTRNGPVKNGEVTKALKRAVWRRKMTRLIIENPHRQPHFVRKACIRIRSRRVKKGLQVQEIHFPSFHLKTVQTACQGSTGLL